MEKISSRLAGTALEGGVIVRPNFGRAGRPFPVYANAFEVTPSDITCYHYDVKITPEGNPPTLNREIWAMLDNEMKIFDGVAVAYDGRSIAYSPKRLPADVGSWVVDLPEKDGSTPRKASARQFTVTIKFTRSIDLGRLALFVKGAAGGGDIPDSSDVQSATQALNVLIQHGPSMLYPSRAASFFMPPENKDFAQIAKGLEMWRGFYTSLRAGPGKLFINVDIASQPMYMSGDLSNVMLAFLRATSRNIGENDMDASKIPARAFIELDRFFRNVTISLKCPNTKGELSQRKIKILDHFGASDAYFTTEEDGNTSVQDYFFKHYGVTLAHPGWPCVRVSKTALWPLELCDVKPGQKYSRKLDPDQTAAAIKLTTVGPRDRVSILRTGIARIQPEALPSPTNKGTALGQWGVSIRRDLIEITARELPAPSITYKRSVNPREGVWDMRGNEFHTPCKIDRWLILVFDSDRFFRLEEAQASIMGLIAACQQAGIVIKQQRPPIHYVPRGSDISAYILTKGAELVKESGGPPQLLICFLPRKPCDEYAVIKRFGDIEKGVATQCLFINKAKKRNPQYYGNVSLKINVKLRGINSVLDSSGLGPIAEKPTMVFGAGVSHPSPGSLAPSIAAVVGSMDAKVSLYGTCIKIQTSRVEVIGQLDSMVEALLKQFYSTLKTKPQRLIFFRDGVSEGQFPAVIDSEVAAIRLACEKIEAGYKPPITYIVCGKRHHMSFFPVNINDGDRKNGNVKAGTTIDTAVTSPFQFDWYNQSHASLLGTGRSCHYTVLVNESSFSADVLQQLVFNLCFTYARCTRSVSYVTPAYYADRVCTRAQLLLKRDDDDSSTVISSHSGSSEAKVREQQHAEYASRLREIHQNHSSSLYFM